MLAMSEHLSDRRVSGLDKPMSQYRKSDGEQLAVRVIDQAIADWKTDEPQVAIPNNLLTREAFRGQRVRKFIFYTYKEALRSDERFLGETSLNDQLHLNYTATLSEGSVARASLSALVRGRGIYTDQERQEGLAFLQLETEVLLNSLSSYGQHQLRFPFRMIAGKLQAQLGRRLTREEISGFKTFMQHDERFSFKDNGDVTLIYDDLAVSEPTSDTYHSNTLISAKVEVDEGYPSPTLESPTLLLEDDLTDKLKAIGLGGGSSKRKSSSVNNRQRFTGKDMGIY